MKIGSVGACTPVGLSAVSAAAAVRAGISTFGGHPYVVDSTGDPVVVAQVPGIDPSLSASQRMATLACTALREAIDSGGVQLTGGAVRVFLSVPSPRPGLDAAAIASVADSVAEELADCGLEGRVALVNAGHAGGLIALRECCAALERGNGDWALVGGADSWLEPETMEWLEAEDRLHNAANPWGLVPGEGAAFCSVLSSSHLAASQATFDVLGFGVATESVPRRGDKPCLGIGLTTAIQGALAALPERELVDEVFADCNGERDRAEEYGFALVRTSDQFVDAAATRMPADCWGDVGSASGALLLALAYQAAERGWLSGPNALLWNSSDGPHRAAAMLRATS